MSEPLSWQYQQFPEVRKVLDQGEARLATTQEYAEWLEGHLWNRWGSVDFDFRDSAVTTNSIYYITKDIDLPPLTGALGLKIIVPRGVTVNFTGDIGDNEVFFLEDYSAKMSKNHKMSIYTDVLDALEPHGYYAESFIYATQRDEFNKAVVRPPLARALGDIERGINKDVTVKPFQLKNKGPQV